MKAPSLTWLPFLLLSIGLTLVQAAPANNLSSASASPTPSTTPKPAPTPVKGALGDASKALVVHKPMPSPHWGKIVQYRKEQTFSFADKDRETLHEFVFQDDSGVIRTAIYHESPKGEGYWEVLVWDQ